MNPALQQRLLDNIDEHSLSYFNAWQGLYAQLCVLDKKEMQEIIVARLQQSGLSVHFLTNDRSLFLGELQVGATQTLLIYIHLPTLALTPLASYITTVLVSYQAALDTCLSMPGALLTNVKWLFDGRDLEAQQDSNDLLAAYNDLLGAEKCIRYTPKQDALLPNDRPLLALGTNGLLQVDLTVRTAPQPINAQYGAVVPNAAWQLVWALGAVKGRREDILIEGFYDALVPVEDEIIETLSSLAENAPSLSQHLALPDESLGLKGLQQYYAYFLTPSCTVSYIHSGQSITDQEASIPQTATAQIDFQLVPGQDPADIYARLQHHLLNQSYTTIQTRLLHAITPTYIPLADPFVQFAVQATTTIYSQPPLILPILAADLSSNTLQKLKLPTVTIPLSSPFIDPQELPMQVHKERLIQHIKQHIIITAGAAYEDKAEEMQGAIH